MGINTSLADLQTFHYVGLIAVEVAIGLFYRFNYYLGFFRNRVCRSLFGIQMGFAVANVVDPTTSQQIGVLSQIIRFIFLFVFFLWTVILFLIKMLGCKLSGFTFRRVKFNASHIVDDIINVGGNLFMIAMKIALPISCSVLLINTGFAALARTTPQLNIFMVAFMVNIFAGLYILAAALPSLVACFTESFMIHSN